MAKNTKSGKVFAPTVKPTNFVANLSIPENYINKGYEDIVQFLQSHPLHYALTATPKYMYPDMLKEFWSTCKYHPTENCIIGSVCKGKYSVRVTLDGLRDVLKLPNYKKFDPLVTEAQAKEMLDRVGYDFPTDEECKQLNITRGVIKRKRLPAVWSYLFGIVIMSLGGKVGSYDQAGPLEMQILHSLVMGTNINYAEVIYNELKKKVSERRINVPYTRFLSLVFQKTLGENYTQADLGTIRPTVIGPYVFHKEVKKTDPKLTTAMRSMINNPYVLPQSDSEADLLDFKANSLDPEADSSDSEANSSPHCNSSSSSPSKFYISTSSSQLSKSPSRNKFSRIKTCVKSTTDIHVDNHEPDLDFYLTPSPSHSHRYSPNTALQDPSTHTSAILQAIMALTSKVDTISSNVESVKSCVATLQTQQDLLERELATLKAQNQNPAPSQNPSSPSFHSSVQGLTSQVSALESEMKAIHHTLQENSITSDAKLSEYIDAIKTQHFCFSVQLENFKNLQEKVHTTALNTETELHNLNDMSCKAFQSLEAKVKDAEPAFSKVHTSVGINNHLLDNLNDKVIISAKAATIEKPAQQSPSPKGEYKAVSSDSKTRRSKRKRLKIQLRKNQLPRSHVCS